jgi:Fe-S cluster assembly protein SufD
VPSGTAADFATIPFAPDAATLEEALELLAEAGLEDAADAQLRREALELYATLPSPGARPRRGWRYDYGKLNYDDLVWTTGRRRPQTRSEAAVAVAEGDLPALATENAGGLFHLGATLIEPGESATRDERVIVLPLADARLQYPDLIAEHLGSIVDWRSDRFSALAAAFENCGAFVYVPDGVVVEAPIQLVFANPPARDEAVFPHILVVLGAGAQATVIERHIGGGDPFVCGLVEVQAGERARLDYVTVQQTGEGARVFFRRAARCTRESLVRWNLAELGSALARTVLNAHLGAEGARCETAALFFTTGFAHVDLTTATDHAVGPTFSDTAVRSAANDRGQGRYVGDIVIRPRAHGSDASLRDDALLLSAHAHIDTVPALEIAANDVKAFHGATVGSLDEDALFYVLSRGIPKNEALRMITLGFFEPVITRFPGEALRDEIRTALDAKIDEATEDA